MVTLENFRGFIAKGNISLKKDIHLNVICGSTFSMTGIPVMVSPGARFVNRPKNRLQFFPEGIITCGETIEVNKEALSYFLEEDMIELF